MRDIIIHNVGQVGKKNQSLKVSSIESPLVKSLKLTAKKITRCIKIENKIAKHNSVIKKIVNFFSPAQVIKRPIYSVFDLPIGVGTKINDRNKEISTKLALVFGSAW